LLTRHRAVWAPLDVIEPFKERADSPRQFHHGEFQRNSQHLPATPESGIEQQHSQHISWQECVEPTEMTERLGLSPNRHEYEVQRSIGLTCLDDEQSSIPQENSLQVLEETEETLQKFNDGSSGKNYGTDDEEASDCIKKEDAPNDDAGSPLMVSREEMRAWCESPLLASKQDHTVGTDGPCCTEEKLLLNCDVTEYSSHICTASTPTPPITQSPDFLLEESLQRHNDLSSFTSPKRPNSPASLAWSRTTAGSENRRDKSQEQRNLSRNPRKSVSFSNDLVPEEIRSRSPPEINPQKKGQPTTVCRSTVRRAELGWSVARLSVSIALDELPPPVFSGLSSRVRNAVERDYTRPWSKQQRHRSLEVVLGDKAKELLARLEILYFQHLVKERQRHSFYRWVNWTRYRNEMSRRWLERAASFRLTQVLSFAKPLGSLKILEGAFAAAAWYHRERTYRAVFQVWAELVVEGCTQDEIMVWDGPKSGGAVGSS